MSLPVETKGYRAEQVNGHIKLAKTKDNTTTTSFYEAGSLSEHLLENMIGSTDPSVPNLLHLTPRKIKVEQNLQNGSSSVVISEYDVNGNLKKPPEEKVIYRGLI